LKLKFRDMFLLKGGQRGLNFAALYLTPDVQAGWCWWYRKYAPGDTVLEELEKAAREARKGCGLIPTRCHRGSGAEEEIDARVPLSTRV